jgi:hypothetical protein
MQNLDVIFSQFDISEKNSINWDENRVVGLSQVYLIDKKYVLRGRPIHGNTYSDFLVEQCLLSKIDAWWYINPIRIPALIKTKMGDSCFIDGDYMWTLANYIPGELLCWINKVYLLSDSDREMYVKWLYHIHNKTRNIQKEDSHFIFADWVLERYKYVFDYFTLSEQQIIENTISDIWSLTENRTTFVHGDYHPGNILIDTETKMISWLIDFDWCHVGSIYEDLSFIILVFIRDISQEHFLYDAWVIEKLIKMYPEKIDFSLLKKYMLVRWVHDLSFFVQCSPWWIDKMKQIQLEIIRSLISHT